MNVQFFKILKVLILGLPFENPMKKCDLNVTPTKSHKWCFFPKVEGRVKLVFEVILIKFVTLFLFQFALIALFS